MSSIKDKLYAIKPIKPKPVVNKVMNTGIEELGGEIVHNRVGSCIVRKKIFPLDTVHGLPIREFIDLDSNDIQLIGKNPKLGPFNPDKTVFIDTETTGLAGGTGTVAFLIGIGFIKNNTFTVEQYFMQDFSHEASVLDCIEGSLEDKSLLVSYNGKSFDIPLLINRFVLYKKDDCFSGLMHIDLVHTARRLWKDKLLFCNLQNIEKQMLGFKREGDIPGGDIPQLYFDYLQTGNLLALKPVFQHNVIDILSMLAIFIRAAQVYKSPKSESEIWGVIKTYEKLKLFDLAELNYQQHEHQILPENSIQYQLGRAQNLKKLKKYGKAKQIWQYLIEKNGSFIPAAYIELLKHIEHRERKFKDAYQIIEQAQKKLDILRQLRDIHLYPELDQEFDTRKIRLLKRLKNECV